MKVLVVGSGGREHAIAWKLKNEGARIASAGCNAGLKELAGSSCHEVKATDTESILKIAEQEKPDLVVIGPEAPLAEGLSDQMRAKGFKVFGPSKKAARIESDKAYAKEFMKKYNIPTARFEVFDDPSKAIKYLESNFKNSPVVVKASGLAAGKGVFVCKDHKEAIEAVEKIMIQKMFGEAGERIVIEEYLEGRELSYFAILSGDTCITLPSARDYKRLKDNDEGPNTGGMGCYAPAPWVNESLKRKIEEKIISATARALEKEGTPYFGVLYAGLMITESGPEVLEFNVRFGDPEAEVLMPLLKNLNLCQIFSDVAEEKPLENSTVKTQNFAVDVVLTSEGYPYSPRKGAVISGVEEARKEGAIVFVAGAKEEDGKWIVSGGRVLNIVALESSPHKAREKVYRYASKINFDGVHYRKDIAQELE